MSDYVSEMERRAALERARRDKTIATLGEGAAEFRARTQAAMARMGVSGTVKAVEYEHRAVKVAEGEPECERCLNMRYVIGEDGKRVACPECRVADGWKVSALNEYSSQNGRAKEQTFGNFKNTSAAAEQGKRAAMRWAFDGKGWLVLYGSRGVGKSHLAAASAKEIQRRLGSAVLFVTAVDLMASLKASMGQDAEEKYSERIKRYQTAPVLIVDDLGTETSSAWSEGVWFEVLDYRYRNKLPTMICTNYDVTISDTRDGKFDPRLVSRWNEIGFSTVVKMTAADVRRTGVRE